MNPDRLAELQRQRELVREHLAWLEREIAAALPSKTAAPAPPPIALAPDLARGPSPSATPFDSGRPDPIASAADAKRGCLVLFVAAFVVGLLALVAIYFLRYRGRPLL